MRVSPNLLERTPVIEPLSYSQLPQALALRPGVTAVIGSGGKTTTLAALAHLIAAGKHASPAGKRPRIILSTTTHIRPFPHTPLFTRDNPVELGQALAEHGTVCCGTPVEDGKLAASPIAAAELARLADYALLEADGSRGLPLKAHAEHEPVIPLEASTLVVVVGAHGFDQPIEAVVHRPALACEQLNASPSDLATAEFAARLLLAELPRLTQDRPQLKTISVLITHVDSEARREQAEQFQRAWHAPVLAVDHTREQLMRLR